jgi:hypothetical protein
LEAGSYLAPFLPLSRLLKDFDMTLADMVLDGTIIMEMETVPGGGT